MEVVSKDKKEAENMWTEEQRKRYEARSGGYESDLTEEQWAVIEPLLPEESLHGRPRRDLRVVINGMAYLLRTGLQWRMLPREFGSWQTVYKYMRDFETTGVWEKIHAHLVEQVREVAGKKPLPTAAIVDSQSVKTSEKGGISATTRARKSRVANAICS